MSFLDDAEGRLQRYFSDGWWDIYDGVAVPKDATITIPDIVLSVALNSQLDTRNKIWHVWKQRTAVEAALFHISSDISLEDDTIPWSELHILFEQFCAIKYAKEAVATKILHKKRPLLIPIYDRFIGLYFYQSIEPQVWRRGGAAFLIAYMHLFQEVLQENRAALSELCSITTANGWSITPVRMLEVLIWIDNEPTGYYRRGEP